MGRLVGLAVSKAQAKANHSTMVELFQYLKDVDNDRVFVKDRLA